MCRCRSNSPEEPCPVPDHPYIYLFVLSFFLSFFLPFFLSFFLFSFPFPFLSNNRIGITGTRQHLFPENFRPVRRSDFTRAFIVRYRTNALLSDRIDSRRWLERDAAHSSVRGVRDSIRNEGPRFPTVRQPSFLTVFRNQSNQTWPCHPRENLLFLVGRRSRHPRHPRHPRQVG